MKRAIIVHGFKGKPQTNWKPWLKNELESRDFVVDIPEMPNTDHPNVADWVGMLKNTVEPLGRNEIFLIGHSLGCLTILRYLETLGDDEKVKVCIFVAGFTRPFKGYLGGHDSFFEQTIDWDKIRERSELFVAIHSEDDPLVNIEELHEFETKLHAKTIPLRGMGHFGSADGVFEAPFIRNLILDIK